MIVIRIRQACYNLRKSGREVCCPHKAELSEEPQNNHRYPSSQEICCSPSPIQSLNSLPALSRLNSLATSVKKSRVNTAKVSPAKQKLSWADIMAMHSHWLDTLWICIPSPVDTPIRSAALDTPSRIHHSTNSSCGVTCKQDLVRRGYLGQVSC